MTPPSTLDLIVLVPGKDEEAALTALFNHRTQSLGCGAFTFRFVRHPGHDPGCVNTPAPMLNPFIREARHALVMFDHEGSGQESRPAADVAEDVRARLATVGWGDRVQVLVLEPELEIWVWSDSPHLEAALGWTGRTPPLRDWLETEGEWPRDRPKPERPKESMEKALVRARLPRSSAIYGEVASKVGLKGCIDPGFQRLGEILRHWFPPPS